MPRLACGLRVSVSVALSLPAVPSITPAGAATVAVFASEPVAEAATLQVAVKVAVPPLRRLTALVAMLPEPDAGHALPALAAQVQVQALSAAGKVSVTVAPVTALGPLFVAVMV